LFDLPPSASTAWWDVDIDERFYRPAPVRKMKDVELREAERRRESRKRRRVAYFRTNVSVRAASVLVARRAEQDLLKRLAPSSPLDARVFDSRVIGPAAYGVALAALCKEQNLGDVRGEGTFSDVYATEPATNGSSGTSPSTKKLGDWSFAGDAAPGFDAEPPRFCALVEETTTTERGELKTYRTAEAAVIKCSVPFPGAVNGRRVGDGLRVGETEARVLASLPPHENVVRLLAAFLSEERNESYLLLKDAGTNLHAMRERGEVSPKDIRRYARVVLNALAHVHKHGVVHRDVKGGNVLVADTPGYSDSPSHTNSFPRATLIDFGVARHKSVPDTEPASRYGTPGYQAPELLMTDMRLAEENHELYAKVDVFALGCTLFFLCVGKELFGATPGDDGADEFGARTKTKARAQLAQEMMDETMTRSIDGGTDGTDVAFESNESGVEEGMVVRRRKSAKAQKLSASEPDAGTNFAAAALARALGRAAERAELESRETEQELDVLMLKSMAEFPGYEPRTPEEVAFVERTYGAPAPPAAPAHRESLAAFVNRKVTPRQPPGFASLIGACLARDPEDRPSAAEALNWPGAWVELDDDA
jgi:serine/threonine protein kinase